MEAYVLTALILSMIFGLPWIVYHSKAELSRAMYLETEKKLEAERAHVDNINYSMQTVKQRNERAALEAKEMKMLESKLSALDFIRSKEYTQAIARYMWERDYDSTSQEFLQEVRKLDTMYREHAIDLVEADENLLITSRDIVNDAVSVTEQSKGELC